MIRCDEMQFPNQLLEKFYYEGFRGKSEKTQKTYYNTLNKFNTWLESIGTTLDGFTFVEFQQYMNHLKENNIQASTINKEYNALKYYCRFIGKPEIYEYVQVVKQASISRAPKALPRNERNAMLREANRRNARDYAIVCFLLYTGVRVEECVELQIKHLFDIGKNTGFARIIGKQNRERVVPLSSTIRQALSLYLNERSIDLYDKESLVQHQNEPLFMSTHYKKVSKRRIQQIIKETGNTHPHTLRHTCATILLREKGYDPITVAQLLGHKSVNTLQIYTQATNEDLLKMVESFDS